MSAAAESRRSYRNRPSIRRREPENDVIASALTTQVMLCILLLVAVFLLKKFAEPLHTQIQSEYNGLVSGSAETGGTFGAFSGSGGFFASIERFLSDLTGEQVPPPESPALPEESNAGEPEDFAVDAEIPDYDYLGDPQIAYTGAGGLFPVNTSGDTASLPAPAGSILSPVYLGAKIKPPVTGVITSAFAYRYHPVTSESDFHTGIDIAAEEGRPILAALPGEVSEVGWSQVYGNYIVLKHATNLMTSYSHCSEIIAEKGMSVRQGERIAKVGQTGVATGPHLHFSVIVEGEFTDPYWVLNDYIQIVE